jgi:hypothetical protein
MTIEDMRALIAMVDYPGYDFFIFRTQTGTPYLQAEYEEPDIATGKPERQRTRKWYLSEHAVKSEIIQTALKCVLTSAEHRVREHFLYRGERVFGPHFDIDALHELARSRRLDYRGKQ